ncbi:MAG: T9SS type A sorting domain-containing protein [Ferruginibacter sp.]
MLKIFPKKVCVFLLLTFYANAVKLYAEGSKELMPDINSRAALCTQGLSGFAGYSSVPADRLYIHIKDAASEIVYLNFSAGYGTGISDILGEGNGDPYYFRIKDPAGNIVFGPQLINTNPIPSGITGYNQVTAGPSALVTGGYDAYTFAPASGNGDYYIEFNKTSPDNVTTSQCTFDYWDITVANTAGAVSGRVWAYSWGLYSKDYTSAGYSGTFKGKMYTYSTDQIVQSVDFLNSGLRGGSFRIGFSATGPGTSGNYILDRQSIYNVRSTGKDYKVFLNDPDITVYPSGSILAGTLTMSSTPITCTSSSVTFNYQLNQGGVVELLLDFNNNGVYDAGTRDRILAQALNAGSQSIVWDLKDGLGNTVTSATDPSVKLITTYGKSVSHLTLADVEYFSGGFIPAVIRPVQPSAYTPQLYYDDENMRTAIAGTAAANRQYPDTLSAFTPASQPPAKEINGCTAPCHAWNNFGTVAGGDYQNNNFNGYGNGNSVNTWWYSFVEKIENEFLLAICEVLPVNRTSWQATAKAGYIAELSWSTASEINHDHFELQRSFDLVTFETIAMIKNGAGSAYKDYSYTDRDTELQGKPYAAYRLLQVDKDNKKTISDVQVVRFTDKPFSSIRIAPNPVKENMQVSFTSQGKGEACIQLLDLSGRILKTKTYNVNAGSNKIAYTGMSFLARGTFIVRVSMGTAVIGQQKIIKQ